MSAAPNSTPRPTPKKASSDPRDPMVEAGVEAGLEGAESPTEQLRAARMMSVAGSFDDPDRAAEGRGYGPLLGAGAPSLEEAVQRFMRAAHPEASEGGALFRRLLGDGPPMAGRAPEKPAALEAATEPEEPTEPEELTEPEEPTALEGLPLEPEPEELATERSDPPWDALLHISLEAARERSEASGEMQGELDAPAEAFTPRRVGADELTAAATPAAISGDPSARRTVRSKSNSVDVEDAEEESFRREGAGDQDDGLDDDSEEILDDRGRLFTDDVPEGARRPQAAAGDPGARATQEPSPLRDEITLDELSAPTPPQGEAYPPAPLRRRATRDKTPVIASRWPHTPTHLALPRIDDQLLAERRGLDPAQTAEPITVDVTFDAELDAPLDGYVAEESSSALATAELSRAEIPSAEILSAEILSDSDILTGEFDPLAALEQMERDLRATKPYEPAGDLKNRVAAKTSLPSAAPAPWPAPAPPIPIPKELLLPEAPEDLVPIAAVQVKRLDQPTARGFRLSLEDAPALGRETPRTPLAERSEPAAQPGRPRRDTPSIHAEFLQMTSPSTLRRHWPIFTGLLAALLVLAALGGLWLYRQHRASRHIERARRMAAGASHLQVRAALEQARVAATQGGRNADVVALAAAAHARLAYEFGESHLVGVASLAEEAKRLGAPYAGRAASDLTLADAYLRLATSSLPQALERLHDVAAAHPQDARLRALYGRVLLRARRLVEAESVLENLPAEGRWLRLRARVAMARGQEETARRLWARARAAGGASAAQVELDRLRGRIGVHPFDAALYGAAVKLTKEGSLSKRERTWSQLVAAEAARERGHWKEARSYLDRALKVEPLADPEFHQLAAQTALRAGIPKQAREQAERALQLIPESAEALALRAKVALALDDEAHARALLARCGKSCLRRKRLLEAEAALARGALKRAAGLLLPSSVQASSGRGGLHRRLLEARLYLARGDHARAQRELSALDAKDDERIWSLRGLSALEAGQLTKARKALDRAIALHPFYAEAHWGLGRLYTRRGNAVEARESFARAVAANPYTFRIRLDLGRLLLRLGRFSEALEHFEVVLHRDRQDSGALAGRARCRVELSMLAASEDITRLEARGHRNTALLLRARLEMRRMQYARAVRIFEQIDASWLAARGRALVWQAIAWGKVSEPRAAARQLEALAERGLGPDAPISERLVRSAALLALGELAFAQKATKKALARGGAALRSLPPRFRPVDLIEGMRLLKARCHERRGAVGAAIFELKEITGVDRDNVPANQRLGEIFLSLGKVERATQHLALAKKARPFDHRLSRLLSRACAVAGESASDCRQE